MLPLGGAQAAVGSFELLHDCNGSVEWALKPCPNYWCDSESQKLRVFSPIEQETEEKLQKVILVTALSKTLRRFALAIGQQPSMFFARTFAFA